MEILTLANSDYICCYDADGEYIAYAMISPDEAGEPVLRICSRRVEVEAADAADACYETGGRLPAPWQAPLALVQALLTAMLTYWHGCEFWSCPSDARRMRVYSRVLDRAGVSYARAGDRLWVTF